MEGMNEPISDLAFDRVEPISNEVDAFNEGSDLDMSYEVEDPIASHKDNIIRIIDTYTKIIRLARTQLDEFWMPLSSGSSVEGSYIDDPGKFSEKEWVDKEKEIERILDTLTLFVRR